MIDRQRGRIIVECDSCEETFESDEGEQWSTFWPRATREGWRSRQIAKEWVHGCPRHDPRD